MSMSPFRIRKPAQAGVKGVAAGPAPDTLEDWMGRLIRLIPSEIVAVYLTGRGFATEWLGSWSLICLGMLLVVRALGTKEQGKGIQWPAVIIAAVSFVIWVYAIGGQFLTYALPDPRWASIAVLVWTTVIPKIYKGD